MLMVASCSPSQNQPTDAAPSASLDYQVGECDKQALDVEDSVTFEQVGGEVSITQDIRYVCCAEIQLTLEVDKDTLRVVEDNIGDFCKCICAYHVEATVRDIPVNVDRVEVWGVKYQQDQPAVLIAGTDIAK